MVDIKAELKKRQLEEKNLQFEHFNNEDALQLGMTILETARERGAVVAMEIVVNGVEIFHYNMPGSNPRQCNWIKQKANQVHSSQWSSLHAGQFIIDTGKDVRADWGLDPNQYAVIGGGFPILLKGTGVIGSVCCSGLPHEQDHQLLIDSIAKMLDVNPYQE